jgi:hypothetical protein
VPAVPSGSIVVYRCNRTGETWGDFSTFKVPLEATVQLGCTYTGTAEAAVTIIPTPTVTVVAAAEISATVCATSTELVNVEFFVYTNNGDPITVFESVVAGNGLLCTIDPPGSNVTGELLSVRLWRRRPLLSQALYTADHHLPLTCVARHAPLDALLLLHGSVKNLNTPLGARLGQLG